jgi:quinol monooxygenase YgiN
LNIKGETMPFTQTIEVEARDVAGLRDHVAAWHAEQAGIAPGYVGSRVLADLDAPGRYLIEAEFSSRAEADRNNDRPETAAWAAKLADLVTSDPVYRSFEVEFRTGER